MKILISCGHWNIKDNCVASLRGGTGAPGESDFTKNVGMRLEKLLQEDGWTTYLDDANTNCHSNVTDQDWNIAIVIHADANIYGTGGGFVDFADPSTDSATQESQRIAKAITDKYFSETGIVNHPERSNANTRFYYLWQSLSAKTPCVLIECGVLQDAHDKVILSDIERVAKGIREGIRNAFPETKPKPQDDCGTYKLQIATLTEQLKQAQIRESDLVKRLGDTEKKSAKWQDKVNRMMEIAEEP